MEESGDFVEQMVRDLERRDREAAIEASASKLSFYCKQRQEEDRAKFADKQERNKNPQILAAKREMLAKTLKALDVPAPRPPK